uniref:HMG box domain-containing protein n=1 Tax=Caenorhabditis tropicalis TaxID=1561998 RepID=A0A1I7V1K8_9PELO
MSNVSRPVATFPVIRDFKPRGLCSGEEAVVLGDGGPSAFRRYEAPLTLGNLVSATAQVWRAITDSNPSVSALDTMTALAPVFALNTVTASAMADALAPVLNRTAPSSGPGSPMAPSSAHSLAPSSTPTPNSLSGSLTPPSSSARSSMTPSSAPSSVQITFKYLQLTGLPPWTPENAGDYEKLYTNYQRKRLLMKKGDPPEPLDPGTPEFDHRYQEALENAKTSKVYQDEKIVLRSALFDPSNPALPQLVFHPSHSFMHYQRYMTDKMYIFKVRDRWQQMKAESGAEYWEWAIRSSDVVDEHVKQLELGYIIVEKRSYERKRKYEEGAENGISIDSAEEEAKKEK